MKYQRHILRGVVKTTVFEYIMGLYIRKMTIMLNGFFKKVKVAISASLKCELAERSL